MWSSHILGFDLVLLSIQRCSSAYFNNKLVFELLLTLYQLCKLWRWCMKPLEVIKQARLVPAPIPYLSTSEKSSCFPILRLWTSADSLDHVYMPRCIELLPHDWLIRCNKQMKSVLINWPLPLALALYCLLLSFFHSWGLTTWIFSAKALTSVPYCPLNYHMSPFRHTPYYVNEMAVSLVELYGIVGLYIF